jgi:lipopolysaccharide export system protein LptC
MTSGHGLKDTAVVETLTPLTVSARPAIAWKARRRASVGAVQRYSRFVVFMKRALAATAVAVLLAVLAYTLQPRQQYSKHIAMTFQSLGIVNDDLAMMKPKLNGVDSDGDPFVVTADQAVQDPHNAKRAQLRNVEADVQLKNGRWLNATATRGYLDATARKMWLSGLIDIFSDDGYEVHTTAAAVDMDSGVITGDQPSHGQGPLGTFRSDRMKIDRDAKLVFLNGNVRMTFYRNGIRTGRKRS